MINKASGSIEITGIVRMISCLRLKSQLKMVKSIHLIANHYIKTESFTTVSSAHGVIMGRLFQI